ncbi:MAG: Lrp/AsnC family transcriptional regulator [Lachnospiraceae bacterium]|nr:Lrp/AsnC family transcriptional regulator [Lachnospiraceae bacterium]
MREQILSYLKNNSRFDLAEMAVLLGIEETAIANEIAAMEKEGVIRGYLTLIDWEKTSNERVSAMIEVKVTPQRDRGFDSVAERIYRYDEVDSVYLVSGSFDLMVLIEGSSMREVAMFVANKLSTLDSVLSTSTNFVLKKYKDHGTYFVSEAKDERLQVSP